MIEGPLPIIRWIYSWLQERTMSIHYGNADDLVINITGSIEKKFSHNIAELEVQASIAMDIQSKCSYDYILPVSIDKTNVLLIHSIVAPQYPIITYRNTKIKFVKNFKYLVWREYISYGLRRISNIYNILRILLFRIPLSLIRLRKVLFFVICASSLCMDIFVYNIKIIW